MTDLEHLKKTFKGINYNCGLHLRQHLPLLIVALIIGTGHPVDEDAELNFIGAVVNMNGHLVWHVFEELL